MKNQTPLVSVVIPTYARNDMLSRAIDSVLKQTYTNIEILVVDDNPPDSEYRTACEAIMEGYRSENSIRYIRNETNLGGGAARNVGIRQAQGEYVAFLDDDDEYYPERIEKQLAVFLKSDNDRLAMVYCFAEFRDLEGRGGYTDDRVFRGNCLFEAMEQNCIAATSQWMVRHDVLTAIGGFAEVPCKQDSQTILKMLIAGYEIDVLEEIQSIYYDYISSNRISGSGMKNIIGEKMYLEECRKQYYRLETSQILQVEYRFASILHNYYRINHMAEKKEQWKIMCRLNRRAAYFSEIRRLARKLKNIGKTKWNVQKRA